MLLSEVQMCDDGMNTGGTDSLKVKLGRLG